MQEYLSADPPLWISGKDECGKPVDRDVIDSAHRIWKRVLSYVRVRGHDLAPVAEILESACHCVSRVKGRDPQRNHIRDLDSYLLWAFFRKYNRCTAREGRIQYVESVEAFVEGRLDPDHNWVSRLEDKILLEQLLSYVEPKIRVMLIRRLRRDSWAEIGKAFGISAHNAEVQYAQGIKKARTRLFGCDSERGKEK